MLERLEVFDHLGPPRIAIGYERTLDIMQVLGNTSELMLVNAIREELHLRLCGDNIKFWVKVRDERHGHHSHMEHYFRSIAILHKMQFGDVSPNKPQMPVETLTASHLLLGSEEIEEFISDYAYMAMQVAAKYFACFKFLLKHLPKYLTDDFTEGLAVKTKIIPLPALHKDESKYSDVVNIMRYYPSLVQCTYQQAGCANPPNIHIGGDLLTRVMQPGSKLLVIKAPTAADRFDCLSPISA